MSSVPPIGSIAAAAQSMGPRAACQLDRLWRVAMGGQGGVAGEGWFRIVSGEPDPLGNVAIVAGADNLDAAITACTPLLALDVPSAVLCPDGASDAVADALSTLGFQAHGAMPAMAVDIEGLAATRLPEGHVLERIDAGPAASEWADVLATGYGIPRGLAAMLSPEVLGADMAADAAIQFFGIRRDGRLLATSLLFLADGVAGIYCVATLAEARGQGLGAHVTAEPLRRAHAVGYRVGVLQSSESGHGVYLRLGFEDVAAIPMFIRMPE